MSPYTVKYSQSQVTCTRKPKERSSDYTLVLVVVPYSKRQVKRQYDGAF